MMSDGDHLNIRIPVHSLADYFSCPVCMLQMTATSITPCGHRYCTKCIEECVDRRNKCPCCNNQIRKGQLIKDHQFDELLSTVMKQKEVAEKQYFDDLITTTTTQHLADSKDKGYQKTFSPVEEVLKRQLKKNLEVHENYYQELKILCDKRKSEIDGECDKLKTDLHTQNLSQEEIESQEHDLNESCTCQKEVLQKELEENAGLVAEAYDRYLNEHIPSLAVLPIKISICLLSKSETINHVIMKPGDSMLKVNEFLEKHMEQKGDKVVEYDKNIRYFCFGPFSKQSTYEMHSLISDIVDKNVENPDIIELDAKSQPVLQYSLKPGCVIAIYGQVKCESDMPKRCFAKTFKAEDQTAVDYFRCETCKFNWICRSCMSSCHRDHEVKPYIMNHKPTWACCYCPKKKKCTIQS